METMDMIELHEQSQLVITTNNFKYVAAFKKQAAEILEQMGRTRPQASYGIIAELMLGFYFIQNGIKFQSSPIYRTETGRTYDLYDYEIGDYKYDLKTSPTYRNVSVSNRNFEDYNVDKLIGGHISAGISYIGQEPQETYTLFIYGEIEYRKLNRRLMNNKYINVAPEEFKKLDFLPKGTNVYHI